MENIDTSIFLDFNKIFSYNCPVNFVVAERRRSVNHTARKNMLQNILKKNIKNLYILEDLKQNWKRHFLKIKCQYFLIK